MRIVFRDHDITVIEKPAGMLSEADGKSPDVLTAVKAETGADCLLIHRLDRETSGLMVLANHKKAAAVLSQAVADRRLVKEYLAVVSGTPEPAEGEFRDLLFRDAGKNRSYVVKRLRKGVKEAVLNYRTLKTAAAELSPEGKTEKTDKISLVRIRLQTGRTHQIRVQFASRKMPLLGDGRYGSSIRSCGLALHSCFLEFPHPATGQPMAFECLPDQAAYPWSMFQRDNA